MPKIPLVRETTRRIFRSFPWTMSASLAFCASVLAVAAASGGKQEAFFTVLAMAVGWAVPLSFLAESIATGSSRLRRLYPLAVPPLLGIWGWCAARDLPESQFIGYVLAVIATHLLVTLTAPAGPDGFRRRTGALANAFFQAVAVAALAGCLLALVVMIAAKIVHEGLEVGYLPLFALPAWATYLFLARVTAPSFEDAPATCPGWSAFVRRGLPWIEAALGGTLSLEFVHDLSTHSLPPEWNVFALLALVILVILDAWRRAAGDATAGAWLRGRIVTLGAVPLCGLLAYFTVGRIAQEGWTPWRYATLLLMAWSIPALLRVAWVPRAPKAIPASLGILLLLCAWGPLSPHGMSGRMRVAHLEAALAKYGMAPGRAPSASLTPEAAKAIEVDVSELCSRYRGRGLERWLGKAQVDSLKGDSVARAAVSDSVVGRMGLLRDGKGWPVLWARHADLDWERLSVDASTWGRVENLSDSRVDRNLRLVVDSAGRNFVFHLDTLAKIMEAPTRKRRRDPALTVRDSTGRALVVLTHIHMAMRNGRSWRAYGQQGLLLWSPEGGKEPSVP